MWAMLGNGRHLREVGHFLLVKWREGGIKWREGGSYPNYPPWETHKWEVFQWRHLSESLFKKTQKT